MYTPNHDSRTLVWDGDKYELTSTDRFWTVIETLPEKCPVPMALVELGIMTRQLQPTDPDAYIRLSAEDMVPITTAIVPPETLISVRKLLYDLIPKLDDETKKVVGDFCELSKLNRPPAQGASDEEVKSASFDKINKPEFFVDEPPGVDTEVNQESDSKPGGDDNEPNSSTVSDDEPSIAGHPFASGKRVIKEGGERITGKNPFADPDLLKDLGAHKGGID